MLHRTWEKFNRYSIPTEKKIFLSLAKVLLWCIELWKNVMALDPGWRKIFSFLSKVLQEHGAWDLEKLNWYSTPVVKKNTFFLETVLLWRITIIISVVTWPSPKKKYFCFWLRYYNYTSTLKISSAIDP